MAPARLEIVDLIRVVATWLVVFFHLDISGFEYGYLGVELFLVLSGFLMMYIKKEDAQRFIMARLRRIFPTLAVFLIGLAVLSFFLLIPKYFEVSFIYSFLTVLGLNYVWSNSFGYFGDIASLVPTLHLWTIPVEMTAYYWVAIGLSEKKYAKLLVYLFPFLIFVLDLLLLGDPYYNSTSRLLFFVLGAYAYRISSGEEARHEIISIFILGCLTLLFYNLKSGADYLFPQMGLFALIILSIYAYDHSSFLNAIGGSKPVKWLASISFETYLVHWGVISLWMTLTLNTNLNFVETVILLPLTLFGAIILRELTRTIFRKKFVEIASLCLIIAISTVVYVSDGFAFRVKSEFPAVSNQALMKLSKSEVEELQEINRDVATKFIGDSHARHFAAISSNSGLPIGLKLHAINDLLQIMDEIDSAIDAGEKVIIAFRWSTKNPEDVRALISKIDDRNLVIIRDIPSFPQNPVPCVISEASPILVTGYLSSCDVFQKDELGNLIIGRDDILNANDENWRFISEKLPPESRLDSHDLLCEQHICILSSGNKFFYRDANHLNERLSFKELGFSLGLSGDKD
jgi:peptidoglycan/LPS O-acetylase OafA/YrhL